MLGFDVVLDGSDLPGSLASIAAASALLISLPDLVGLALEDVRYLLAAS